MAVNSSLGTCLSVSVAAPATHNSTGFAALTYTQVGEIESIGDVTQTRAAITFKNLCTGKTSSLKGSEEGVNVAVTVALDRDDAGQALMSTAYASNTQILSIRIQEANNDILYLRAYVMGNTVAYGGGPDEVKRRSYSLGVVAPSGADPTIVEVNAV
jgi:hypothetical protein